MSSRRWITMTTPTPFDAEGDVMELLRQGIPITLLLDLADPGGPHSRDLYVLEGSAA
jgi:hypothetical protein